MASMDNTLPLAQIGLALALALAVAYEVGRRVRHLLSVRAADRIAASYATEQALMRASPALRQKVKRYRFAKLQSGFARSGLTHTAATELVDEHRLFRLEHR